MPMRGWKAVGCGALLLAGCVCGVPGEGDGGEGPMGDAGPCVPPQSTNPCRVGACDSAGNPVLLPLPDGTAAGEQHPRDCRRKVCLRGTLTDINDDSDVAYDDNECTDDTCQSGLPWNPARSTGTRCDGGTCNGAGACVECLNASQCPGADTECRVRTCRSGRCGVSSAAAGTPIAAQTMGDCQRLQCTGDGGIVGVPDDADVNEDGNTCTQDSCSGGVPSRVNAPGGTACGVGLVCNASGQCVGCNGPADCGGPIQCRTRTCSGSVCGLSTVADNTACSDGNLCSQTDRCVSGACVGQSPVVCTALDQCHLPGTCVPDAGTCSNPNAPDDAGCNDNSLCSQNDRCVNGACVGLTQTVCTATGQCRLAGSCNPATGACSSPSAPDDAGCSDENLCTQVDRCVGGTCVGQSPIVCTALDQCHLPGACIPDAGVCTNPNAPNDAGCSDNNLCTQADRCVNGACVGQSPVVCTALDQCHLPGACIRDAGVCTNPNAPDDAGCTDANQCTQADRCVGGVCVGQSPVQCAPLGQCYVAGTCAPATGTCSNPFADAGSPCSQDGGTLCNGAGVCSVGPPSVTGTTPAEGAINQSPSTGVLVSFSEAISPASLTTQVVDGACTGSVQLSVNGFASCLPMSAAAPTMQGGNTGALLTPRPRLGCGSTYRVRVTSAAQAQSDGRAVAPYTSPTGFTTESCFDDHRGSVAISQVFAGAPDAGAAYNADFVELHNRGDVAVALTGYSLQFASDTGATWTPVPLVGSIAPGGYFLVQVSAAGAVGSALPTPDLPGTAPGLSTSGGRVLLATTAAAMTGVCPSSTSILDYVGWGTASACLEGSPPSSAPADNATALARRLEGCQDTGANSADFALLAAAPRSSASRPFACATANESNQPAEADYCNVQFPATITISSGQNSPAVFGQVYEAGVTEAVGAPAGVRAQLGFGPATANPSTETTGWAWFDASWNVQSGNNDEFQAAIPTPPVGTWRYGFRFSLNGMPWTYCDVDGAGANAGLRFDPGQQGTMTVSP